MFMPVMVALLSAEAHNSFWSGWLVLAWVTMGGFFLVLLGLVIFHVSTTWQKGGGTPTIRRASLLSPEEEAEREAFLRAKKRMAEEEKKIKSIYCAHEGSFIEDEEFSDVASGLIN